MTNYLEKGENSGKTASGALGSGFFGALRAAALEDCPGCVALAYAAQ